MITVLMPVYNASRYLRAAVDSILGQTFREFEFLIIDDGSTDDSSEIIRSYGDSRIRFVRNERNLGITQTLNRGIDLARFEYIARMDADDVSYPIRLEVQYRFMQEQPEVKMVCTGARVVSKDGVPIYQGRMRPEHLYYYLAFVCWVYHPTVLYRKSAVKTVGGYTREHGEDYALWCELSRKFVIRQISETLVDYRRSENSLCSATHEKEYVAAEKAQMRDNIRYFTGSDGKTPDVFLDCFRNEFSEMRTRGNVKEMASCVRELDRISAGILRTENVNRDPVMIRQAATKKRTSMLTEFLEALPASQRLELILRAGGLPLLFRTMKRRRLKKSKTSR